MTDVKVLILALTTERNAIDRAIAGLQAMREAREGATEKVAPPRRVTAAKKKTRMRVGADVKAVLIARMAVAPHQQKTAEALSREFGLPATTINGNWRTWRAKLQHVTADNGAHTDVNGNRVDVPDANA